MNEGPSTFTLVYWGFMNPHSLRVGPAGFLRIFYGSPSTSFLQICIVRVYHYVKGSTIFSQCWQRPPGILFAITCPSSKKSQSFLMQLLLQVVRCCLKQIALCYHPTAAICRPTNWSYQSYGRPSPSVQPRLKSGHHPTRIQVVISADHTSSTPQKFNIAPWK